MQERKQSYVEKLRSRSKELEDKVKNAMGRTDGQDPRFWRPSFGKDGVGHAVIRLLPPKDFETNDYPVFKTAKHFFKMPNGQFYTENCPRVNDYNAPCPACEKLMWEDGDEAVKRIYRERCAKGSWITNIIVIKDTVKPENNGKVFLWAMTKSFHDEIMLVIEGKHVEGLHFDPYNLFEGANMKINIKTKKVEKKLVPQYEVNWGDQKPLTSDDKIDEIISKTYELSVIMAEDKYKIKDYKTLQAKLNAGFKSSRAKDQDENNESDDDTDMNKVSSKHVDDELKDAEESEKKEEKKEEKKTKNIDLEKEDDDEDDFDFDDDDLYADAEVDVEEKKSKSSSKKEEKRNALDDLMDD